jgi:NAD dependent epimerase/dehydratase family enzyme
VLTAAPLIKQDLQEQHTQNLRRACLRRIRGTVHIKEMMPMRAIWIVTGVVIGVVLVLGSLALTRAFGQGMSGGMGSMMMQMMGPQAMTEMMGQVMHDPQTMGAMASACATAMKDPAVLRSMQAAMDNPQMRGIMQQMLELMR